MDKNNDPFLVNAIFEKLKEGIILGHFKPGEKLRIESLKAFTGAGPTPIREALSKLTETGLIEAAPNRGFFVKEVSIEEILDIYDTFLNIELLALEKAMKLGSAEWEASIVAALYTLGVIEKNTKFDLQAWLKANNAFHNCLISACRSPQLLKIRADLYLLFERYCYYSMIFNSTPPADVHQVHEELANAVIARDKNKAFKLTTEHLNGSLKIVLDKLNGKK